MMRSKRKILTRDGIDLLVFSIVLFARVRAGAIVMYRRGEEDRL